VSSSSLVVVAAAFLFYAVLSRRLDGTPLTAAMIFVGVGFVLSNEGLDWLHFSVDQEGVQVLAEATLAVVLFTDASRIDLHILRREYGVPTRLLDVGLLRPRR
jgi:NhaP-type Na+/H+ or K+/H+ antiporter